MEKNTTITIRINESEKEALKMYAGMYDIPMSQVMRQAVKEYIERRQSVKEAG